MRIPRFYQASPLHIGQTLDLSADNFRHAIQVMRLKTASPLILFNGEGGEYIAELTEIKKKSAHVRLVAFDPVKRESPLTSKLVLALIKPDKFDFALQKAVELGVSVIQPVKTERSIIHIKTARLEKKMNHWQGVISSACEQSGRTHIPPLLPLVSLHEYLQTRTSATRLAMLPTAKLSMKKLITHNQANQNDDRGNNKEVDLLIGPEGGYSEAEEVALVENEIATISFGSRILRAETAVIAGLTALQLNWGDLS